jgi:hypothetical protein
MPVLMTNMLFRSTTFFVQLQMKMMTHKAATNMKTTLVLAGPKISERKKDRNFKTQ